MDYRGRCRWIALSVRWVVVLFEIKRIKRNKRFQSHPPENRKSPPTDRVRWLQFHEITVSLYQAATSKCLHTISKLALSSPKSMMRCPPFIGVVSILCAFCTPRTPTNCCSGKFSLRALWNVVMSHLQICEPSHRKIYNIAK